MGNLKTAGIVFGVAFVGAIVAIFAIAAAITPAVAVDGSGVAGATIDPKYAGLTQDEIIKVKIAKESCDNNAALTSIKSATMGEIAYQRCLQQEQVRIDNYRAN